MQKTILVTGGAGYVGYTVVEELAKKYPGARIVIYDDFSKGKLEGIGTLRKKIRNLVIVPWEKGDIRDGNNFEDVMKKYQPEIVIHLAAIVNAFNTNREGKDRETMIVNYESTVSIAKIAKKHGAKIFIFQSTVSIYSRGEELVEESKKEPLSIYGKSKLMAEKEILKLNDSSFNVIIIRPATIVGYNPCFRYETIINLLCIRATYKVPTNIFESAMYGNKTYLYLKDNARAIIFAIEKKDKMKGKCFNVTSFHTNLNVVLNILKKIIKEDFPYVMKQEKTISQQVYTINSDKIKKIGFEPIGRIDKVIEETVGNLKKNRGYFSNNI